jgi:hypothetical protein
VQGAFADWANLADMDQVCRNVADETALGSSDFVSFLSSFGQQLANSAARDAFLTACRCHKRRGCQLAEGQCPEVLGRVKGLDDHAVAIEKASASQGGLTKDEAKRLLLKYSGAKDLGAFGPSLREARLGNYLVWATFNPEDPRSGPFGRLPQTHGGLCTALGLGGHAPAEPLVALTWSHVGSGAPPLHRPTVADAEDYPFYRPCRDASAAWGLTKPLDPNPDGHEAQPEVVMPETSSQGLVLPFQVVRV